MTDSKGNLRIAALLGALGVALGAYGAHGLGKMLAVQHGPVEVARALEHWGTAVQYHLIHAVALVCIGSQRKLASLFFIGGILLFSGSLYVLVLTNTKWLGAITPLGGLLMIAGWLAIPKWFGKKSSD